MSFYIIFFSIVLFFSLFSMVGTKKIGENVVICNECYYVGIIYIFLLFFLISAFRFEVGTDYIAYQIYAQENILGQPFFQALKKSELFFVMFSKLSYIVCGNMQLFYIIVAFFVSYFTLKGITYYEQNIFLPVLFFIVTTSFFISLNAMRQMVSFSIFLYASRYIIKQNFKKYFIYILFAFCWHTSAVFYLPCYYFARIRINKLFIPFVCLVFVCKRILNIFIMNLLELSGLEMAYYFVLKEGSSSKSFIVIVLFISVCFWVYCCKEKGLLRNLFFNILLVLILISVFGDGIPGSFRLIYLFWPMTIVICPYIYHHTGKIRNLVLLFFIFMFLIFFYRNHIVANVHEVVPYASIFRNVL